MNQGSDYRRALELVVVFRFYLIDLLSGNVVHEALHHQRFGFALLPISPHDSFPLSSFCPLRLTSGTNFNLEMTKLTLFSCLQDKHLLADASS